MYLTQALKRAVQVNGGAIASHDHGRERTWAEIGGRVAKLAGVIRGLGIEAGDRVAMLALNSDRYFEYFYAVPWAGGVFVPINTRLAPPEIAYWLNDSGSRLLFIDDNFLDAWAALAGELETVEQVIHVGDGAAPDGMLAFEEVLAAADPVEEAGRGYDDLAAIFYTGGTTGKSKGVMLCHRNLVFNSYNAITSFGFRQDMRWLHAAPMFHLADGAGTFAVTMAAGSHVFIPGFTPEGVLAAISSQRVTHGVLVPTMINMLVHHPDVENYDLSSLETIVYGASPMPEAVIRRAMQVIPGCGFIHAYGQTETAPIATKCGPEYHVLEGPKAGRFKSVGHAVLGVEVRVIDEAGQEVPRGTVGQVCVRGPNVMQGYWHKPAETAAALVDGWMRSGDGGYMDEEGFLYIVDRVKDMIISGGENVYSAEVEDAVHQHPAVAEAAVIGVPDDKWGERVHAIVRCRDGAAVSEAELIAHCHALIAGYKCPKTVAFRDQPMPLSGAGKILKTELRKPYWEGHEKQVN